MKISTKVFVSASEVAQLKAAMVAHNDFVKTLPNMGEMVTEKDYKAIEKLFEAFQVKYSVSNSFHNLGYLFRFKDTLELDFDLEIDPAVLTAFLDFEMVTFELLMPVADSVYAVFKAMNMESMAKKFEELYEKHKGIMSDIKKEYSTESGDAVK